jgi:hypothetical protein
LANTQAGGITRHPNVGPTVDDHIENNHRQNSGAGPLELVDSDDDRSLSGDDGSGDDRMQG